MTVDAGQYSYNGLLFGEDTDLIVIASSGLEGVVVRNADRPLPRGHGSVPAPHYSQERTPIITFALADTPQAMDVQSQLMADHFNPQPAPLPLEWRRAGGNARLVYARPVQVALPRGSYDREPKVAFTCADPRIYSADLHSVSLPLYVPSGGQLDYPGDYPKDFPSGSSVDVVASNAGAADAYPLLRFYGPTDGGTVTSVTIRNLRTGQVLTVTTPIVGGQILTVDNTAHVTASGDLVVALDGASRYGAWDQPRLPFALPPGDSLLRFETTGTSTAVACVLTWHDTWLS